MESIVKLLIKTRSSLLIGGYSHTNPFADKSTARLESGLPVIPASAIKGAVRIEFERLYAQNCNKQKDDLSTCHACKIFGRVGDYHGLVIFSNAHCLNNKPLFTERKSKKEDTFVPTGNGYTERPGVVINRKTRTSEENKLFLFETTELFRSEKPLIFEAKLQISPQLKQDNVLWNEFKTAVSAVFAIGGSKSRGMGFCECELQEDEKIEKVDKNPPNLKGNVLNIKLQLISEHLTIGANRPYQHFIKTRDYVPGSTVRGAMAKALAQKIRENSKNEAENVNQFVSDKLKEFFIDSGLIFDDCLYSKGFIPARLIPVSAQTCKVYSGFKSESTQKDEKHGVIDTVISDLTVHYADLPIAYQLFCPTCNGDTTPFTGYYQQEENFKKFYKKETVKRIVTRSSQNRKLRNSEEGKLFSIESIDRMADKETEFAFAGTIRNVKPELINELSHWDSETLHIGAEISTGYGNVIVELTNAVEPIEHETIKKRIIAFNIKLKEKFEQCKKQWDGLCKITEHDMTALYFTIDLLSDTILFDENGLYESVLPENLPESWTGGFKTERIRSYASSKLVSGWFFKETSSDTRKYMPKRVQQAIQRASVFVYRIKNNMDDPTDKLFEALCELELKGIGERKQEGYGHIRICDEFHYMQEVC